jgi:hypothetical protein
VKRLALGTGRLWVGLLLWLGIYWIWAPFVPSNLVGAITSALVQALALGVVVAYARGAREALRRPLADLTSGVALLLAISGLALFTHLRGDYGYIYQALGQPEWMRDNKLNYWLVWGSALFLAFHLLVKNAEHGMMPNENLRVAGAWIALTAFLLAVGVLVGTAWGGY